MADKIYYVNYIFINKKTIILNKLISEIIINSIPTITYGDTKCPYMNINVNSVNTCLRKYRDSMTNQ